MKDNGFDKGEVLSKVTKAIESVRPYLNSDGGDIILEEITDDLIVKVRLTGACDGCKFSVHTLKAGVEQAIRKELPELKELQALESDN